MATASRASATLNQNALASRLGCTPARVSQYLRRSDWPFGQGEWDEAEVPSIKRWREALRAGANATASSAGPSEGESDPASAIERLKQNPERYARVRLMLERTAALKFQREQAEGKFIDKDEVERGRVQRVLAVRSKLEELSSRSALIAMKPETECAKILDQWAKEICNHFAGVTIED
jgi:transcriptional regulator with XRE-family HTH domain